MNIVEEPTLVRNIPLVLCARLEEGAKLPSRKNKTDAGIDFYPLERVEVRPGTNEVVRTGVTVEVPEGYMLLIKPRGRSEHGVGSGVIDTGYEPGEVLIRVFNYTNEDTYVLTPDKAFAQGIFVKISCPTVVEVDVDFMSKNSARSGKGGIHGQGE